MVKKPARPILFWTPEVLGLLFAAFLSLFALDIFGQGYGLWETAVGLFMHLLPVWAILIALAIAWRWEWLSGILFIGFGAWYLLTSWGKLGWPTYLIIAGPAFLIGALFLIDWRYRAK
jgi:hypothetical protein